MIEYKKVFAFSFYLPFISLPKTKKYAIIINNHMKSADMSGGDPTVKTEMEIHFFYGYFYRLDGGLLWKRKVSFRRNKLRV